MQNQAPDIAQHFGATAAVPSVDKSKRDDEARTEEAELEQLADRVSAARSVY